MNFANMLYTSTVAQIEDTGYVIGTCINVRFIERDGMQVLQKHMNYQLCSLHGASPTHAYQRWEDVELGTEETENDPPEWFTKRWRSSTG